jgi:Fe-S cluster biogenesis protein NfuA
MNSFKESMNDKIDLINKTIEEYLNPGLQIHSGSMEVVSYELQQTPPLLKVKFHGMCGSCPSSFSGTLTTVSNFLREETGIHDLMLENITDKPENFNLKYVFQEDDGE